ncbi:hypothetical protein [Bradyrhizobium sp. Tv2a-2]|uniref:hypothetical protein n=1 Tax=Bradyrhizobium sp. Tv2a-2 TaxID=113395 RepID=UPI00040C1075|nr:hypothetical protein [Bradyrhizobium sp. Tv2a-2]
MSHRHFGLPSGVDRLDKDSVLYERVAIGFFWSLVGGLVLLIYGFYLLVGVLLEPVVGS